jgi:cell division protease FtsH
MDTLASILGGHAAEELVFGEVTTGASNDIERATELAQRMVCQYGMSDRFGPMALGKGEGGGITGRASSFEPRALSDDMSREVDLEVRRLIDEARVKARRVLGDRREKLEELTALLLERETLGGDEFRELAADPIPAPVEELVAVPVAQADTATATLEEAEPSSTSARLAKRLRVRPRSVIRAVNDGRERLSRGASEALKGKAQPDLA